MRTTLLDDLIITADNNSGALKVYKHIKQIIKETTPVAHIWNDDVRLYTNYRWHEVKDTAMETSQPKHYRADLPHSEILIPDGQAMCLCSEMPLISRYSMCIDTGLAEVKSMTGGNLFSLMGALFFQKDEKSFEVIPLIQAHKPVLPEVQLHFELGKMGWIHTLSTMGPVNPMFHNYFIEKMNEDQKERTVRNLIKLGDVMSMLLASYLEYVSQQGQYTIRPAKAGKPKIKKGVIKKMLKPATVGYKEFVPCLPIQP